MSGRGAWPGSGTGGTLRPGNPTSPGPYYMLASEGKPWVGSGSGDVNARAVHGAVLAIQRALNRNVQARLAIDGQFGPGTHDATKKFQQSAGVVVDGLIGMQTAKAMFLPQLQWVVTKVDWHIVCGIVTTESSWDPGAVGYVDDSDVGLAQINGPSHPDFSEEERLRPHIAFEFVQDYILYSLSQLSNNERDAVASYNLGVGGARSWISDGRPDVWNGRNVKAYIDKILSACA